MNENITIIYLRSISPTLKPPSRDLPSAKIHNNNNRIC